MSGFGSGSISDPTGAQGHASQPVPYDRTPNTPESRRGPAGGRGIDRNRKVGLIAIVALVVLVVAAFALFPK